MCECRPPTMRPADNFCAFAVIWAIKMVILLDARPQVDKTAHAAILGNITKSANSTRERVRILTHPSSPIRGSIELGDEDIINDQDIIFPDSLESTYEPIVGQLDAAPRCAGGGGTFCETIDSYPYGHLRDVLRRTKGRHTDLLGMDETSDEIANRIGEQEETYICGAVDRTVYPKVGKTKNNKWKYIVNQGAQDGYVQGVRVETCRAVDKPCDLIDSLPDGYTTSCKQKFVYRRMLSISDGGQPVPDTFLMPSACCCAYKRDNRFLARFGSPPTTPVKRKRRLI